MKKFYMLLYPVTIVIVVFTISIAHAQQLISTSGGLLQNSQKSINFSIGESLIDCYSIGSVMFTQGMQQPNPLLINITYPVLEESLIRVYPNPTSTGRCFLFLSKHSPGDLSYRLVDSSGLLIQTQKISHFTTALSLDELASSVYFLQIIDHQSRVLKTVKITKL